MQPTKEELTHLYRLMLLTRQTEEAVDGLFKEGKIQGMGHWSTGQEAAGVGVGAALRSDDYLFPTHRGWPEFIGKGMSPASIVAEFAGKSSGPTHGKGGVHISSADQGIVGLVGSLGSDFPVAVGAALSAKMRGSDQVSCVYFGEGTAAQADFHPAMHLAMLWNLPVIFACVNNQYVELHHYKDVTHLDDTLDLAAGYHMHALMVEDGNDVAAVYEAMTEAVSRARAGQGPSMLEIKTYRLGSHFTGDPGTYMPQDEVAAWQERDPIARCRARLLADGVMDETGLAELEGGVEQEVQAAMQFVLDSPLPTVEDMYSGLYVDLEVVS
ncbi:MAG: thiamine pyrophosphate-dependent dehydrogenase E1 component subunit alpha [Anaerolineae bacterium]